MSAITATSSKELKTNKITLYGNHIGPDGAASVASVMEERPSLRMINLQTNSIGVRGATAIANALESDQCGVTKICLGWTQNIGDEGAKVLARALIRNRRHPGPPLT